MKLKTHYLESSVRVECRSVLRDTDVASVHRAGDAAYGHFVTSIAWTAACRSQLGDIGHSRHLQALAATDTGVMGRQAQAYLDRAEVLVEKFLRSQEEPAPYQRPGVHGSTRSPMDEW